MITKREQLAKLHYQLSKCCSNINMMIQPLYFLPVCLQFLWIQLPLSFTTQFIYESFISYHLTWHIPLNKTLHVPSFSLECSVRHLQNINKTENHKGFFVNRNRTTLSRFLSYKVSRLRSLLKFQDFALLLASPNNCHGVSCVGTLFTFYNSGNPTNVDCVTIGHCTKYVNKHVTFAQWVGRMAASESNLFARAIKVVCIVSLNKYFWTKLEDVWGRWVLFKGLFARREDYLSTHTFPLFFLHRVYKAAGVTCVLVLPWQAGSLFPL